MIEKFLNEYISIVAGSGADKIVSVLFKKKNVNEFLIAKKLDLTINQTRNILYKLADGGLVYFMRKKDLKSGGWYTYFWTLNDNKCLISYRNTLLKEIEHQESILLNKKTKQFYICKTCGIEVMEESALLHDFTCSECGEVYSLKDSVESVNEVERSIKKLKDKEAQLQIVIEELAASQALALAKAVKKNEVVKKIKGKKSSKKPVKKAGSKKISKKPVKKAKKNLVKKPLKKTSSKKGKK